MRGITIHDSRITVDAGLGWGGFHYSLSALLDSRSERKEPNYGY